MKLKTFKKNLLKDEKFRKEYYKKDLTFEISQMLTEARIIKGITQEKLAKKIGTKQPSIARIENGNYLPSLSFLQRIARALNTYLIPPRFAFMEKSINNAACKTLIIEKTPILKIEGAKNISYPAILYSTRASSSENLPTII